jgi:hypothetical protein
MIETKVIAATAGGATGGVVGSFVLWLLGVLVWHVPGDAKHAIDAMAAVPEPAGAFALFLLGGLLAFAGGYWAPHTHRPDLATALVSSFASAPTTTWPGPAGNAAVATEGPILAPTG